MRPRIAITGTSMETKYGIGTYINKDYVDGIVHAGGVPMVLPLTEYQGIDDDWICNYDGLLLSGGEDVDPQRYGQNPHPKQGKISPERDELECRIVPLAIKRKIPIFAICRGLQVLNVACGGTLFQDIQSQVPKGIKHSQIAPRWYGSHSIQIAEDSQLYRYCGNKPRLLVNSYHHQSIDKVAKGYKITAIADDGVIEAIEGINDTFILGVQWHPEEMWQRDKEQLALFKAFVAACIKPCAS